MQRRQFNQAAIQSAVQSVLVAIILGSIGAQPALARASFPLEQVKIFFGFPAGSSALVGLIAQGSTPAELGASQKQQYDRWGPLIKRIGFTAES